MLIPIRTFGQYDRQLALCPGSPDQSSENTSPVESATRASGRPHWHLHLSFFLTFSLGFCRSISSAEETRAHFWTTRGGKDACGGTANGTRNTAVSVEFFGSPPSAGALARCACFCCFLLIPTETVRLGLYQVTLGLNSGTFDLVPRNLSCCRRLAHRNTYNYASRPVSAAVRTAQTSYEGSVRVTSDRLQYQHKITSRLGIST